MKRNIVLITTDQMRGDCIGALGHPDVKTPFLDMMINKGVAFDRAYSATPTCIPARAAIFTGLTQRSHKRVGYRDFVDWNYKTTLPQVFAENGYHTQCIGKMHVWPPRSLMGFHNVELHDGFLPHRNSSTFAYAWWNRVDDYIPYLKQHAGYNADINDWGIDANSWVGRPYTLPEFTHPTNWTVTRSIDFLRRRDTTKPFFLWTSFVAPHPPLLPPTFYFDMYDRRKLHKPYVGSWSRETGCEHPDVDCFEGRLDEDEIHQMRAGYYGLITHLDHQIGRFIRALKDEGVLNNTVILFTSDHGEMLGDHNMFRKSQAFEGSVSIPMLLFDPGNILGLKRGERISALVELRDVMPTLLEAAEIPVPEAVEGRSFLHCGGKPAESHGNRQERDCRKGQEANCSNRPEDNRSNQLAGNCDSGQEGDRSKGQTDCSRQSENLKRMGWREYLHGEHTSQQGNFSTQYIVTMDEKYIWYSNTGEEMLFNLKDDPHELINLAKAEEYSENLAKLRALLVKELEGREEGYSDGQRLYTGREPVTVLN